MVKFLFDKSYSFTEVLLMFVAAEVLYEVGVLAWLICCIVAGFYGAIVQPWILEKFSK